MSEWRFAKSSPHGDDWLRDPSRDAAIIEYRSPSTDGQWRRIVVATRAWVWQEISKTESAIILPPILIVPGARGDDLRRWLEVSLESGMCDRLSTPADAA